MEVIIIGSGCGVPSLERSSPSVLIKTSGKNLLFDTGTGTMRNLLKAGLTYQDIDALFYSHFHPDHTLDLISFLFACKYPLNLRKRPLKIFGPVGIKNLYERMLALYGEVIQPAEYKMEIIEMVREIYEFDGYKILTCRTPHTPESIAYRLEDSNTKSVTYSGDTDYCHEIIDLSKGSGLLILECAFPDEIKVKGHLIPKEAGQIAKKAGVKKLVLTHIYPVCKENILQEQCRKIFDGEVLIAKDLMKIKL